MPGHGGIESGLGLVALLRRGDSFLVESVHAVVCLLCDGDGCFGLSHQVSGALDDLRACSGIDFGVGGLSCLLHGFGLPELAFDERRVDVHKGVAGFDGVALADIDFGHASGKFA